MRSGIVVGCSSIGSGVSGEGLLGSRDSGAFKGEEGRLLKVTSSCILIGESGTD